MVLDDHGEELVLQLHTAVGYLGIEKVAETLDVTPDILGGLMDGKLPWSEALRERFHELREELSRFGWDLTPYLTEPATSEAPESGVAEDISDCGQAAQPEGSTAPPQGQDANLSDPGPGTPKEATGSAFEFPPATQPVQVLNAYRFARSCAKSGEASKRDQDDWKVVENLLEAMALSQHGLLVAVRDQTTSDAPLPLDKVLNRLERLSLRHADKVDPRREYFVRAKLAEALRRYSKS